ncbi:DUF6882 domain-containing protein [Rugosimonospora africana]|uniref:Uncharacterized protein n=1 Tax=Rugosimonospora africana TaxID=556532 RepID=A0A8J3QMF0_9ACTN|nr:DUF6882 domain-containing protein [Rugosimonospora africana]GIH13725.1 hypothetical protein Raf01_18970 [Rugosimonospora africana]
MTQPLNLDAMVDRAAFFSHEHQLHLIDLAERFGEHRFEVDLNAGTLDFVADRPLLRTAAGLLGSASEGVGTWLWGWANPAGFSAQVTAFGERIAQFGRAYGVRELVDAELPLDAYLAARLVDAAKLVTGRWTSYSGQAGPGLRTYLLIDAPELHLPVPGVNRSVRVIGEALSYGLIHDHRLALLSYAQLRGLTANNGSDGKSVRVWFPDGQVTVEFDGLGRIGQMSAEMRPPQRNS